MSYSVLRKPWDVAKSGLRRRSRRPVGRATTSGTGHTVVVTPLTVVVFPNQRIAPLGAGVLTNEKRMKGGDHEKG